MTRRKTRLTKPPDPPAHISERAATQWRRVAQLCVRLKTVREADLPALELLVNALATEQEARALLDKEGITVNTGAGGVKPHPAVRMAETARAQAIALLDRFGLNPRSRRGIDEIDDDY
jgi:P27 family predicted phage terminase small subunit